ncbi:hypothetical protein TYRP_018605 [Tyrophagus putrescentiae]|nr:hypothetical protein TYRP_018605 [Tyrophagus putrescentiae]
MARSVVRSFSVSCGMRTTSVREKISVGTANSVAPNQMMKMCTKARCLVIRFRRGWTMAFSGDNTKMHVVAQQIARMALMKRVAKLADRRRLVIAIQWGFVANI